MSGGRKDVPVPGTYDWNPKEWAFMHEMNALLWPKCSHLFVPPVLLGSVEKQSTWPFTQE